MIPSSSPWMPPAPLMLSVLTALGSGCIVGFVAALQLLGQRRQSDAVLWEARANYWFTRAVRAEDTNALLHQIDGGTYRVPDAKVPEIMRTLFPESPRWNAALRPKQPKGVA